MKAQPSATPATVHPHQRGAASLAIVVVWLAAASLVVLYVNRALVFEQRTSANQSRAAVAFEAAEAGIEWALATLSHAAAVDAQCRPTEAPSAGTASLRARLLHEDAATGHIRPGPAQAGCRRAPAADWQCGCPAGGAPAWPAALAEAAFLLQVQAAEQPGTFGLVAIGCAQASGFCGPEQADALARVAITVAGLPLLAHAPAAPLMAQGVVTLDPQVQVANTDADSGGYTAVAGGSVVADPSAQLISLPGRPGAASLAGDDATLRGAASVFAHFLGLGPALYRGLPGVKPLDCGAPCRSRDVSSAWGGGRQPVLWVDGALDVDAELPLGRADAPLLLVVDGPVHIRSAVEGWGLVVARSVTWDHAGGGLAAWHGALVAQQHIHLSGGLRVQFDAAVLRELARLRSFVRVPGGWHDFEK